MEKLNLALIAGGWSGEREISIMSGETVARELDKQKYNVKLYDPLDDIGVLYKDKDSIDLAIIMLHGKLGEDGRFQGFLDILGIPYLGSGTLASSMCFNKVIAKKIFHEAGLEIIKDVKIHRSMEISVDEIIKTLGLSSVVKPVAEGSSIGISICHDKESLLEGVEKAFQYDKEVIIEQYVNGREVTCCVLGNDNVLETLPIIEIIPDKKYDFFDYEAKYTPGASKEVCPAHLSEELNEKIYLCAKEAHKALKCSDWSRTDMIIDDKKIYMLETNTIPGMTETSLVPLAAGAAGISMTRLLDKLIKISLKRQNTK